VTLRHLVPDRLELTVDDDGRGISAKEAKKVFEPFYRDLVSRANQEKGSGLGLFLAQRQARRMGGDLKLESPWRRLDGSRRSGCRFQTVVPFTAEVPHGR
jgi:signal transduction histidine kinase